MNPDALRELLEAVRAGRLSVGDAQSRLSTLPFEDLGFAKIDHHRALRCGHAEVVFGPGKLSDQLTAIVRAVAARGQPVLVTRVSSEQAAAVTAAFPATEHDPISRTLVLWPAVRAEPVGSVLVLAAGTADRPVAEEARVTAEVMGARVESLHDVGVAGLHRLLAHLERVRSANVIVAVAGMEGALPSVVAGLTDRPVIAVPTSVGYGASFGGLAPLLTMLNTCAAGVAVVNIDAGFNAGRIAAAINALAANALAANALAANALAANALAANALAANALAGAQPRNEFAPHDREASPK